MEESYDYVDVCCVTADVAQHNIINYSFGHCGELLGL